MNKVITINLNGIAYQLEEDGFEALRAYLDTAARRLEGNPDKDEIIADIEQSIADKFRAFLGANKTVVMTKEVAGVIAEMGPVQDGLADENAAARPGSAASGDAKKAPESAAAPGTAGAKHLYKIHEGAMIGGVCNGIAAYLGIDVTIIRIIFVVAAFVWGTGGLLYLLMMFIIPWATTSAEMAAATGSPSTAEEFIRRARAGYYGGMKTFKDKRAYREWKSQFKREMRQHKHEFQRNFHQNMSHWRQNWHQNWAANHPYVRGGSWIAAPIVILFCTLVWIIGISAIISLLTTGAVFGFWLPAGLPVWAGILILFVLIRGITWPARAMRHGWYYGGNGPPCGGPFMHLVQSCVWIIALVVLVWLADHHSSQFHDALERGRHEAHHALNRLRDWWDAQ